MLADSIIIAIWKPIDEDKRLKKVE